MDYNPQICACGVWRCMGIQLCGQWQGMEINMSAGGEEERIATIFVTTRRKLDESEENFMCIGICPAAGGDLCSDSSHGTGRASAGGRAGQSAGCHVP